MGTRTLSINRINVSAGAAPVRQLAAVIACGEDECSAWNLETGAPIVLLRNIPQNVPEFAARRPPFLTRVPTRG